MIGTLKNILKKLPPFDRMVKAYDLALLVGKTHRMLLHNVRHLGLVLSNQQLIKSSGFSKNWDGCPRKVDLKSKMCLQKDLESIEFAYWLDQIGIDLNYHRKYWELAYACQAVWQNDLLTTGKRGLGFAVGMEPLPSYFAAHGVKIHATDGPDHLSGGWANTNQYAANLEALYRSHLISREAFDKNVSFEHVDMNNIPEHLQDFDFCWSLCSLEHLGSIELGLEFIVNSLKTLKSGGYAIHTTEYNVNSNTETQDFNPTVLFRRQDLERIAERLTQLGHEVIPLDFSRGELPLDNYIDLAPDEFIAPHLKLFNHNYIATSFGLIVKKK